jgi:branched-chain amino acid transport system substrate-binding protein
VRNVVSHLALLAAIGLAAFGLGACGSSGDSSTTSSSGSQGSSKGTVKVALVADLTGLFAPFANTEAMSAYIDSVNAKGGVDGYKVDLKKYDSGSDPAKAVQAFRKAIADNPAGIISATFVATPALPSVAQSGIPAVGDGFAAGWTGRPTLFSVDGDVSTHLSNVYFMDLKKFAGATKIALIGSARLRGDLLNLQRQAAGAGVQLVMKNFGQAEVLSSAEALTIAQQIKKSGAQGVVSIGQTGVPQLQEALNQLGAKVTVLTTQFGPAKASQNGLMYAAQWATHYTEGNPGVTAYIAAMNKAGHDEAALDKFAFGPFRWAQAALLVEGGLKAAGSPFSHDAVVKALGGVKNFTANGLVPPASFPKFQEVGTNCHSVMKVVDGKWKGVTSGPNPFVCGGPSLPNPE